MLDNMHRLHPRGRANTGICVDRDGAMLGPDCVLVGRTQHGFRGISRKTASVLQKCAVGGQRDDDWLFQQCQRIADSLNKGEIALAQIYGLRIPVGGIDDRLLKRLTAGELTKWSFNPDEPRVPKGDPHGGEWTSDGDDSSAASTPASPEGMFADFAVGNDESGALTADASGDGSSSGPGSGSDAEGGGSASSDTSPLESEFGPLGSSLSGLMQPTGSAVVNDPSVPATGAPVGDEAQWLAQELPPTTLGALRLLMARLTGASMVFGTLFIPTNSNPVTEGQITGSPDLSYRYDSDTGVLQIRQNIGSLGPAVFDEAHIGTDGLFRDAEGQIIGRYLSGSGVVIDAGALLGYRMLPGSDVSSDTDTQQQNEPKLCPDPSPDRPGAPLDNPYQQYVSMLVNGRELQPGLAVSLFNPISGNPVVFDDCRLTDGTMIEAKGDSYLDMLLKGLGNMPWLGVQAKLVTQANSQLRAAQGRPIEWYFKAQPVADFVRDLFDRQGLPITVIYAPQPE